MCFLCTAGELRFGGAQPALLKGPSKRRSRPHVRLVPAGGVAISAPADVACLCVRIRSAVEGAREGASLARSLMSASNLDPTGAPWSDDDTRAPSDPGGVGAAAVGPTPHTICLASHFLRCLPRSCALYWIGASGGRTCGGCRQRCASRGVYPSSHSHALSSVRSRERPHCSNRHCSLSSLRRPWPERLSLARVWSQRDDAVLKRTHF